MTPHHEHEFEAAPGLPEPLPVGERILWQGAPDWHLLAKEVFHLRQLAWYFGGMLVLQVLYLMGEPREVMLPSLLGSASLAGTALGLLALGAWLSARTTLYTLTSRRVVLRIGIVLTITLNVPLRQVRGADFRPFAGGLGDITLALAGRERLGWLHLWPHARPWALRDPQPALRCIPDAEKVAARLMAAWQAAQATGSASANPSKHAETAPFDAPDGPPVTSSSGAIPA